MLALLGSLLRLLVSPANVRDIALENLALRQQLAVFKRKTHLSLAKDAPATRVVQGPEAGEIVEIPQLGGLHHRYERRAA